MSTPAHLRSYPISNSLLLSNNLCYTPTSTSSWISFLPSTTRHSSSEYLEHQFDLPLSSDPLRASHFGRFALGATTPPPLSSPSMENRGDASVTSSPEKTVNRPSTISPLPKRVPVHPVPPFPLSILPMDEFDFDSDPCLEPFQPSYESPPSYRSAPYPHDHRLRFLHPPPASNKLSTPLTLLGVQSAASPPRASSPEDISNMEDYDVQPPALASRFTSWTMRGHANEQGANELNPLGLQATSRVITSTLEDFQDAEIATVFPTSIPRAISSLSERLRRLAPPPLYIPNAYSFLSDSGIVLETDTTPVVLNPVTALYFPPTAQTPLEQYLLLQAPARNAGGEIHSPSTFVYPTSPSQMIAQNLQQLGVRSPRIPPPLERRVPRALPSVTPRIQERLFPPQERRGPSGPSTFATGELTGGGDVARSELIVFERGQGPEDNLLSPIALSGHDEHMDDIGGRALSCVSAVEWIFHSLGSCTFIQRKELELLCSSLKSTLTEICHIVRHGPINIHLLGEVHGPEWDDKYQKILTSLQRNIDYFYLQADSLGKRPPRIHRVAAIWQKLWGFLSKFESLERELEVFHEHIRALEIRTQLQGMKEAAQQELEAERTRRTIFKEAAAQARAQRKEMRAEMRRQHELSRCTRTRRRLMQVNRLP